jgi:hypothetical protein
MRFSHAKNDRHLHFDYRKMVRQANQSPATFNMIFPMCVDDSINAWA